MAQSRKQAGSIGNTSLEIPRPGSDEDLTEASSTSSLESIASELSNTLEGELAPKSPREALGLLQSRLFDMRQLQEMKVLLQGSSKGNLFIVISWPGHTLGENGGHILADGVPVLTEEP